WYHPEGVETMRKIVKTFLSSLAVIALVLVPACKHTTKPGTITQTAVIDTTPTVPVVVTQPTPPRVEQSTDFVKTDTTPQVTEGPLPTNLEELNRLAQERGLLQDAFFGYDESALTA